MGQLLVLPANVWASNVVSSFGIKKGGSLWPYVAERREMPVVIPAHGTLSTRNGRKAASLIIPMPIIAELALSIG